MPKLPNGDTPDGDTPAIDTPDHDNLDDEVAHANGEQITSLKEPRRVILCFDGTGNKFQGNESDTNIVKLYEMLEKNTNGQYHYYQPGIGTYQKGQSKNSSGFSWWTKIRGNMSNSLDQALGSSFIYHVLAGYEFVMRYFQPGDHIYIFGFSRGAYTARFLAEMLHNIGLLSKGNEEMVEFAWETFSNFQQSRGNFPRTQKDDEVEEFMKKFKWTFCRPDVSVHFLGLFDCVNSVGQFEIPLFRHSYQYMAMPAAKHIRHAVSIHERRLKFKPALFHFDEGADVDLKEVWFAGGHADVGGGWGLEKGQTHLLSDTPLNWMIQEVLNLPNSASKLAFTTTEVGQRQRSENAFPEPFIQAATTAWTVRRKTGRPHDMLVFGRGTSFLGTISWWIIEILPIFTRLELENGKWVPRYFPPNLGAPRDIPEDAVIHESVDNMIQAGILDANEVPRKGGDNSHFPGTSEFQSAFKQARKKIVADKGSGKQADDQTPLLAKGGSTSNSAWNNNDNNTTARHWD